MTIVSAWGAFGMLNRGRVVEYKSFSVGWTWRFVLLERRSFKATVRERKQKSKTWSDRPACFWSSEAQSVGCLYPSYEDHTHLPWTQHAPVHLSIPDAIHVIMPTLAWMCAHNDDLWKMIAWLQSKHLSEWGLAQVKFVFFTICFLYVSPGFGELKFHVEFEEVQHLPVELFNIKNIHTCSIRVRCLRWVLESVWF